MADYVSITNSQVQPKAPVTSELVTAFRDNPTAIAEGATGAPRIATRTHTFSRSSAGTSTSVFSDADEYGGLFVQAFAKSSDPTLSTITVAVSDDGATYSSELTLCDPAISATEFVRAFIDFTAGAYTIVGNTKFTSGTIGSYPSGTITHVRFSMTSGVSENIGGLAEFQGGETVI